MPFQRTYLLLSFHINSLHYRELLSSQRNKTKKKNLPGWNSEKCHAQTRARAAASGRQAGFFFFLLPHPGRSAPAGESVYHDFSKFNRRNMMSIKGDKNFNTSICSGGASKPRNLTLGVELSSGCQRLCQVSICFIRCTFFIALSEICPQQPQTFFISYRRRRKKSFLLLQLFF